MKAKVLLDETRRAYRRFRMIGYYSAPRRRTVWTRALDAALFGSLLLAIPATLAAESVRVRPTDLDSVSGGLVRGDDGTLEAFGPNPEGDLRWSSGSPFGEWRLAVVSLDRGWPRPSMRRRDPPHLVLNRFDEAVGERAAGPDEDGAHDAVTMHLSAEGHDDLVAEWQRGAERREQRAWGGTALNTMFWWVALSFLSFLAIRGLAFVAFLGRGLRIDSGATRVAHGRCRVCNYDLRGLEFSERCPECGALTE